MPKTIADYASGRNNNFNLLRFIAASAVIFAHSYWLGAAGQLPPLRELTGLWDEADMGVNVFFVISGFLITQSYLQRRSVFAFIEARALRIFPALWVALLFTVLIIGPLVVEIPLAAYFTQWATYEYLLQNATLIKLDWDINGVFTSNPESGAVNNSLWTLPEEIRLYLMVALLGMLGVLRRTKIFNLLFFLVLIFIFDWPDVFTLGAEEMHGLLRLAAYFALGSFMYINRRYLPLHPLGVVVLAVAVWLLYLLELTPLALGVFAFALAYTVLWFALYPAVQIHSFNRLGDYSYGIYIYAYPIQQTIVHFNETIAPLPLAAVAFGFTLLMAVISWHYLERPALSLKGKIDFDRLLEYLLPWQRASAGIEQVHLSGPLLKVNRRLCRMLGYSKAELLELSFRDITHPNDLFKEEELLAQLASGEIRSYYIEKRYLHKKGYPVPVRVTSLQVNGAGPKTRYRISIIEDLRELAEAETSRGLSEARRSLEIRTMMASVRIRELLLRFLPYKRELSNAAGRAIQETLSYRLESGPTDNGYGTRTDRLERI